MNKFSSDLEYLRGQKTNNENEDLTENIEDKYSDTKKPFPKYKDIISSVNKKNAFKKQAGPLLDRLQQEKKKEQGNIQQLSSLISGAIEKFRSLIFEVKGSDKIIEIAKTGTGLDMKVFEDKDSVTPSSEKSFTFDNFLNFFMQKLAPQNPQQVAQELSNKGIAQVSKGSFASVKASLRKASYEDIIHLEEDSVNAEDAEKVLGLIKEGDLEEALEYLKQWDMGDNSPVEENVIGRFDETFEKDDYIMYWNTGLGYVGLVKKN